MAYLSQVISEQFLSIIYFVLFCQPRCIGAADTILTLPTALHTINILYMDVQFMSRLAGLSMTFLMNISAGKGRQRLISPLSAMEQLPLVKGYHNGEPYHWQIKDYRRCIFCVPITPKILKSQKRRQSLIFRPLIREHRCGLAVQGLMCRQSKLI